ncbi:hypothetical protein L218DRAFT_215299 [Marasmius fiardii PR-910]|nr:hypothetical protein L218DRAFT_215299 [Marasmius fiardii PR-910]
MARAFESAFKTISHTTQPPKAASTSSSHSQEANNSNGKALIPKLTMSPTNPTFNASGSSSTVEDVKLRHKNENKDRRAFVSVKHSSRGLENASRKPGKISVSTSVKQDVVFLQNVASRRGAVPSTPTKIRGPAGATSGSSSRFTPSSKFPRLISISDSESDQNDAQILSATDSTVLCAQEASVIFDVPPGSKQTSLSSIESFKSFVQRKRSLSDSLDSPRATKAARTRQTITYSSSTS